MQRRFTLTYSESVVKGLLCLQKSIIKNENHFFFLVAIYSSHYNFNYDYNFKHFPIKTIHYPIEERLKSLFPKKFRSNNNNS